MKSKRLVITGAGGFLGRNLVLHALKNKNEVTALVHKNNPFKKKNNLLKVVKWNFNNIDLIGSYIKKGDILIHLAAYIPTNFDNDLLVDRTQQF